MVTQAGQQAMMNDFTSGTTRPEEIISDADIRPGHNPLEPSRSAEDEKADLKNMDDNQVMYVSDLERSGEKEAYIPQDSESISLDPRLYPRKKCFVFLAQLPSFFLLLVTSGKPFSLDELPEEECTGLTVSTVLRVLLQ